MGANWAYLPGVSSTPGRPRPAHAPAGNASHQSGTTSFEPGAGDARAPGFVDHSFDTDLAALVFRTIPDAGRVLRAGCRVLRPGGELRFREDIRPAGRVAGPCLDAISGPRSRLPGGRYPNRRTLEAILTAGFELVELAQVKIGPLPAIVGVARPGSAATGPGES